MSIKSALRKIKAAEFCTRCMWDGSFSVVLGKRHAVVDHVPQSVATDLAERLNAAIGVTRKHLAELAGGNIKQETLFQE